MNVSILLDNKCIQNVSIDILKQHYEYSFETRHIAISKHGEYESTNNKWYTIVSIPKHTEEVKLDTSILYCNWYIQTKSLAFYLPLDSLKRDLSFHIFQNANIYVRISKQLNNVTIQLKKKTKNTHIPYEYIDDISTFLSYIT